ncbi:MAG: hypothetical protein M1835_000628 [Candelina submexicana]|nr:MAG: hypothetical protein M1835_000628 [Candelina submexicana]
MANEPLQETSRARNGILPVSATTLQKASAGGRAALAAGKSSADKLKVTIRRLPPGLTRTEFEAGLGEDWIEGKGKVDYFGYTVGKVSERKGRPSAAVLHLTSGTYLNALLDKVRQTTFTDAKNTTKDACLLGPPTVEYALYQRIPSSRQRHDPRQGTIDQDPEFQAFLQELTDPITKPSLEESAADAARKKPDKVTTTPLIEAIREKKAGKSKPSRPTAQSPKHARLDPKDSKGNKAMEKKPPPRSTRDMSTSPVATRRETAVNKAAKDAVKVLTREASNTAKKGQTVPSSSASNVPPTSQQNTPIAPAADRKNQRGGSSVAARILQRDLGLNGSGRRGRREAAAEVKKAITEGRASSPLKNAENSATASSAPAQANGKTIPAGPRTAKNAPTGRPVDDSTLISEPLGTSSVPPNVPTGPSKPTAVLKRPTSAIQPPTGPAASRTHSKPINTPNKPTSTPPTSSSGPLQPAVSNPSTATQAFLKHANASQGITEPLLEEAFLSFGAVTKVEIDKKKGFAYIDFADPESLQKAIKASPVKVAQGSVQVLERKADRAPRTGLGARGGRGAANLVPSVTGARGGRGGRGGAVRGGANVQGGTPVAGTAAAAPATAGAPAMVTPTPDIQAASATPPSVPAAEG